MKQLRGKHIKRYFRKLPKRDHNIVLVLENIQYAINVANIFRTAESAGVSKLYLAGISQKPPFGKGLQKVSRGAEHKIHYEHVKKTLDVLSQLKSEGYYLIAIELTDVGIVLSELKDHVKDKTKICFVAGNEDSGVNRTTLEQCDVAVTIPTYGKNPSLNVNVSVGIVLFSF